MIEPTRKIKEADGTEIWIYPEEGSFIEIPGIAERIAEVFRHDSALGALFRSKSRYANLKLHNKAGIMEFDIYRRKEELILYVAGQGPEEAGYVSIVSHGEWMECASIEEYAKKIPDKVLDLWESSAVLFDALQGRFKIWTKEKRELLVAIFARRIYPIAMWGKDLQGL